MCGDLQRTAPLNWVAEIQAHFQHAAIGRNGSFSFGIVDHRGKIARFGSGEEQMCIVAIQRNVTTHEKLLDKPPTKKCAK